MSKIKVNSLEGVGASTPAITIDNASGTCTANITNNLSNRNLIINGAMQVAQRGTSSTSTGYQTVDRFNLRTTNTDQWAFTQTHEDVAVNEPPFYTDGFRKYFDIQTTTVETGNIGSDEYVDIFQRIEANNTVQLGYGQSGGTAKTLTLSFWVRSYQTGTFAFYVYLSGGKMQSKNYTVSASNTWEKKSFIIEPDGADAQLPSSDYSLQCGWILAAGSDRNSGSTSTSYISYANANIGANQTADITSSTNNFFHLTGVQLEVGSVATDFEHRSFAVEKRLCMRYYQQYTNIVAVGYTGGSLSYHHGFTFPVEMRAAPTYSITNTGSSNGQYVTDSDNNGFIQSVAGSDLQAHNMAVHFNHSGSLTNYRAAILFGVDSTVYQTTHKLSAEL